MLSSNTFPTCQVLTGARARSSLKGLGAPMRGIAMEAIPEQERLAVRGW